MTDNFKELFYRQAGELQRAYLDAGAFYAFTREEYDQKVLGTDLVEIDPYYFASPEGANRIKDLKDVHKAEIKEFVQDEARLQEALEFQMMNYELPITLEFESRLNLILYDLQLPPLDDLNDDIKKIIFKAFNIVKKNFSEFM